MSTNTNPVVFVDFVDTLPAKATRGRLRSSEWDAIFAALSARPGHWAEIGRRPRSAFRGPTNPVKNSAWAAAKARGISVQVAQRTVGDESVVYARVVSA